MIKRHKAVFDDLNSLPEHVVIQINETHPALAMPELMRILMDEEDFGWDEAYGMVKKIFHYTNHTIMSEAMECWDENMFRLLLPRIYQIICAINEKYCQKLSVYYSKEEEKIAQMAVIGNNEIRMANLCVALCRRINGVSNLHADILKNEDFLKDLIRSFHKISCDHKWDHTQTLVSTGQSGAISSGKRVCERGYFKGLPSV